MTHRERVLTCLDHRVPDRTPVDGSFRPEVWEKLFAHFGTRDEFVVSEALGLDFGWVGMGPSEEWRARAQETPAGLCLVHPDGSFENEWGVRQVQGKHSAYLRFVSHPLADESKLDTYQFPDLDAPGRWEGVQESIARQKQQFPVMAGVPTFYLASWNLRGMEDFLTDLRWNIAFVEKLIDRLLERHLEIVRRFAQMGVDIISLGGDITMHTGPIFHPEIWRKYFKPADAKVVAEARKYGVKHFYFHSDGNLTPYLADLIEIGFDIFDPIQPECMDPAAVKREFGDRITLHGTISAQHTLPHGTVEEVRNEVRQRIRDCGDNGGLVIAPNNVVQPDVPLENLLAVYETAKEV